MKRVLAFLLVGFVLPSLAGVPGINDVIINEFAIDDPGSVTYSTAGNRTITYDWIELLVVNGPVDLRNAYLDDNSSITSNTEGEIHFGTAAFLSAVPTGTYILIIVQDTGTDDTDPSDGRLILHLSNSNLSDGGDPGFNISSSNDNICLVNGNGELIDFVAEGTTVTPSSYLGTSTTVTWNNPPSDWASNNGIYFTNDAGGGFNNDDYAVGWNRVTASGFGNLTPGGANTGQDDSSLPVTLISWSAEAGVGYAKLSWQTASEIENLGFLIARRRASQLDWSVIASYLTNPDLKGLGSSTTGKCYQYIDQKVYPGVYQYQLRDVDYQGRIKRHEILTVKIPGPENLRASTPQISSVFPNPFNSQVTIRIHFEALHKPIPVRAEIYSLQGTRIATLWDGYWKAGDYELSWQGTNDAGETVTGGVYWFMLRTSGRTLARKLTYLP